MLLNGHSRLIINIYCHRTVDSKTLSNCKRQEKSDNNIEIAPDHKMPDHRIAN